jgi:hypothetical protein
MQKSYLIKMFVSYEGVLMFCSVEIFQDPRLKNPYRCFLSNDFANICFLLQKTGNKKYPDNK